MRFRALALTAISAALLAQTPASAHHAADAAYLTDRTITVKGVLQKVDWINPHVLLHMQVMNSKHQYQTWLLESYNPSAWKRAGFNKTKLDKYEGTAVTVQANPTRSGAAGGYFRTIQFPDGTSVRFARTEDGTR